MVGRRGGRGGVGAGLSCGVRFCSGVMGKRGRGSENKNFFNSQLSAVELSFDFTFNIKSYRIRTVRQYHRHATFYLSLLLAVPSQEQATIDCGARDVLEFRYSTLGFLPVCCRPFCGPCVV